MKEENKTWTPAAIAELLKSNNCAVERAIVAIYHRQTADEKAAHTTAHTNGVGFSGADAGNGTYYAKWILSGKHLTGAFLEKARRMAIKYRAQLADIATQKAQTPPKPAKVCECPQIRQAYLAGVVRRQECVCDIHGQVELPAEETDTGTYTATETATCDLCHQRGEGRMSYYKGTPVVFTCRLCGEGYKSK